MMTYLEEFKKQIDKRDFHKFFQLWEEYCTNDQVDTEEFLLLLKIIKESDFAKLFGQFAETALPIWNCVVDEEKAFEVLKYLIDLQNTNSAVLAEVTLQAIEKKYGSDPKFKDRIRQIGLRTKENFQRAISNYELLAHMEVGCCVYHTAGWGTGEIMEISPIREQIAIEFENVAGIKHLTFDKAFKTLIPLEKDSFLSQRFSNPDALEEEARKHPVSVIKLLLKDLGPKTAAEIKDELCELVIPEDDWTKWWQGARTRIKKDTMIQTPSRLQAPFQLRETEVSHDERLLKDIQHKVDPRSIIQISYSYVRDFPNVLKKKEVKETLKEKLMELLAHPALTKDLELQLLVFLENQFGYRAEGKLLKDYIQQMEGVEDVINNIEIIAFKKRALMLVREHRSDWMAIFASMFFSIPQGALRDYILTEMNQGETKSLIIDKLEDLLHHPLNNPEVFVWYFQKVSKTGTSDLPFHDKEGQCRFFESFFVLLHKIEHESEYRDLTKKMVNFISAKRWEVVRALIEDTSLEFIKEFILLISKCHVFSDHDKKILRSLAQVVQPSLAPKKKSPASEQVNSNILWTTEEGYNKTQERVKKIATIEMIENAREVEAARELGDLRENAEYKFACERRSRLQGEMKMLSNQLSRARVLTTQDIITDEVGVGSIVELQNEKKETLTYTILGPWDTHPEEGIISFQSKLAQSMIGCKIGDVVKFKDEEYKIASQKSFMK